MLILNIDDDADDGFIFMEAVREINPAITCLFISNGREAIQLLSNDLGMLPDYIFLDINMPGMNGKECLVQLRKMKRLQEVCIVMFSTAIPDWDRPKYNELNAECFQKPADFQSLKTTLKKIIGDY
jgi:CheY-like chemotaxis protein